MVNTDLLRVLGDEHIDFDRLKELVSEVKEWSLEIDSVAVEFVVRRRITQLMAKFESKPFDARPLEIVNAILGATQQLSLNCDLWEAQNIYFSVGQGMYHNMKKKSKNNRRAEYWIQHFDCAGDYLRVNVPDDLS